MLIPNGNHIQPAGGPKTSTEHVAISTTHQCIPVFYFEYSYSKFQTAILTKKIPPTKLLGYTTHTVNDKKRIRFINTWYIQLLFIKNTGQAPKPQKITHQMH